MKVSLEGPFRRSSFAPTSLSPPALVVSSSSSLIFFAWNTLNQNFFSHPVFAFKLLASLATRSPLSFGCKKETDLFSGAEPLRHKTPRRPLLRHDSPSFPNDHSFPFTAPLRRNFDPSRLLGAIADLSVFPRQIRNVSEDIIYLADVPTCAVALMIVITPDCLACCFWRLWFVRDSVPLRE